MQRPLDLAYILPMGYSPALETEYITPCKTGSECSTLNAKWENTIVEPRRYQYDFSWLPYKRKPIKMHPFATRKSDCVYLICTGCHKPATNYDANKINKVLGFVKPEYKPKSIDLDGLLDYDF